MSEDSTNPVIPPKKPRARYGQRLDTDVYDPHGVLLLRRGKVVQEKHWVPRLQGDVMAGQVSSDGQSPSRTWQGWGDAAYQESCDAHVDELKRHLEAASAAKEDAAHAVASVFERIRDPEQVDVSLLRYVVSSMVASLVKDPRALLSLALLKDADNYTHTHSVNVAVLSMCLAMHIGHRAEVEEIGIGGLVHDVGKVEIPPEILHKPGTLSDAEAQAMRQHPIIGARLLEACGDFSRIAVVCARDHHESVNGRGYPDGKKGNEVCLPAQIISVADVYDALTTDRPYRAALLPQQALKLMTRNLSDAFDPVLLNSFVSLIGYHPAGTTINLTNGYGAVVLQNDPADPMRPALVRALTAPDGSPLPTPVYLDMRANPHMLRDARADDAVIDKAGTTRDA